jgi:hypothetical protein
MVPAPYQEIKKDTAMNGQNRARLKALAATVILLLTGITACNSEPRAEQAITIAETLTVTLQKSQYSELGKAFHKSAEGAALNTEKTVTQNLVLRLKHQPAILVARTMTADRERG